MRIAFQSDDALVYEGDCLEVMQRMVDEGVQVDSIVTDPPYELGFMGKKWDAGGIAYNPRTWELALALLKPGGHLLAFGGTRTYHRMTVAIEDAGFEIRDCIMWVYGQGFPKSLDISKAIDKKAGAEREVVGRRKHPTLKDSSLIEEAALAAHGNNTWAREWDISAPATDAAKRWEGWGTALKPGYEIAIMATKLDTEGELNKTVKNLTLLGNRLWLLSSATIAETLSTSNQSECEEAASIALWSAAEFINTRDDLCAQMGMSPSELMEAATFSLNIVSSWLNILEETLKHGNTSTIETKIGPTIDWKTLNFCLSEITLSTIIAAQTKAHEPTVPASHAAQYFDAALNRLSCTLKLSALESVMSKAPAHSMDVVGSLSPNLEPIVMARKPLIGTVAENVLEHGVGGLNIDKCRIAIDDSDDIHAKNPHTVNKGENNVYGVFASTGPTYIIPVGRFPANLIHDGSDEVLEEFPTARSSCHKNSSISKDSWYHNKGRTLPKTIPGENTYSDAGSAARFFYCAKASKKDRNGSKHPTIKPIALMEYLCRMITPPGGTVLDPFGGSGTTARAAINEGFKAITIEREAEYVLDIVSRLKDNTFSTSVKEKVSEKQVQISDTLESLLA